MRKLYNRNICKIIATSTLLTLGCITSSLPSYADEVTTLRWASFVSPKSATNRETVPEFIKAVEEASEGTLKIEFYPGGTLGKSPVQQLSMVENGVADIAEVVVSYTPGRFPDFGVFELPFLTESNTEAGLAAWRLYEKDMLRDFDDLMMIGVMVSGPYGIASTKPIETLSDMKGQRVRAAGPTQSAIVAGLGATPVGNIPGPAIAENLSRKLLDGTLMAPGLLKAFRISDAATHHNWDVKLGSVTVMFPMRKDTFEKLPEKAKAALMKYSGEPFTKALGMALDAEETHMKELISSDSSQTVHTWDEANISTLREQLASVSEDWNKPNENGVNIYEETQNILSELRNE